jgi:hypothetical protein
MRKVTAFVLTLTVALAGAPLAFAQQETKTGDLQGVAQNAQKQPVPDVRVQVRGADGKLAATGTTNSAGQFSFKGLNPGVYTVEILNEAGTQIVGTASVTVTPGATATVSIFAAAPGAVGAAGAGGLFGLGMTGTVAVIAGAAAITTAAIVATRDDASPSR